MADDVMTAEDVKRGIERMRALQQQEWDDRALGALVREMPSGFNLFRGVWNGHEIWIVHDLSKRGIADGPTPEAALRMAMEKGKCSD